jgi:hypothetical protein
LRHDTVIGCVLDAILSYVGYALTAKRLQDPLPAELMDPGTLHLPAPGAVLAARFFAPKITDVSEANTPATTVGRRKLARLQSAPGSAALRNGIDTAYVLFNFFAPLKAANPFDGRARRAAEAVRGPATGIAA